MAIVMREYRPRPEVLAADKRVRGISYVVEGPYPDATQMTEDEKRALVRQEWVEGTAHIASIRQLSLDEHLTYLREVTDEPLDLDSLRALHAH